VVVYAFKNVAQLATEISARKIHRAEHLVIRAFDADLLDRIATTLDRNNTWELSVTGGTMYLTIGGTLYEGTVDPVPLPD
jgi:uncharacterized protein YaeQ